MHEWALDDDEDRNDMLVVKTANPFSLQSPKELERRFASPSMKPWQWARFACGVWMFGEQGAISEKEWRACEDPAALIPDGATGVVIGVDLGWRWDTTHAKGGHIHKVPLAFETLISDVEVYIVGREATEYLLYPKQDVTRPMTSFGIHLWFKRALREAKLPETIKMHELRHSAADNLWRETGNIVHAKQLLRHRSVGTTEAYLHPSMDDLTAAMRSMGDDRGTK